MDTLTRPDVEPAASFSERALAERWLAQFEAALRAGSQPALAKLFAPEAHWRDLVAFTWTITPGQGASSIAAQLAARQKATQARGFAIAEGRTPPRRIQRAGFDVIEAIFRFETAAGRGFGVLRLLASDPGKAFQLMTSLHELRGFEEKVGKRRPTGEAYSRNFGGTNWSEQRAAAAAYTDREPTVLIVGGGQGGLSLAATLARIGVDALVVDKFPRVGDCWRQRYHSLALHNDTIYNHLPYMPFPESWPTYLPKDMVADWFEAYAWAMEINFWTGTEFVSGRYDATSGTWDAVVRHTDGFQRTLHPKHLVFANGLVGSPHVPKLPGLEDFGGQVLHTTEFTNGIEWRGRKALVIGTGTSGHDVAQDLHCNGVDTTIVQRGETMVLSIDPSAKLTYGVYNGVPIEDGDLFAITNTKPIVKKNLQLLTARMVENDR
jgi:putative flavoprotein involved in K+ transport